MFETTLVEKLKTIFDMDKATFDRPGESNEQECIFIDVESARPRIMEGRQTCRVIGKLSVFANNDKLPYGYFAKCLEAANSTDTRPFFFYEFEENNNLFRNIVERNLSFVYFFDSQYNPSMGTITSVNLEEA